MPSTCIVCSHTKVKRQDEHRPVSLFRFPANKMKRGQWLTALGLSEGDIKQHTCICSRHFLNGDSNQMPSLKLGRRFSSPKKRECVKRPGRSSPTEFRMPAKRRALSASITPTVSLELVVLVLKVTRRFIIRCFNWRTVSH